MTQQIPGPTRRTFLQTSAAISLPTILPATALGRNGLVTPNDRISIGVIGTGKMCHGYHLDSLLKYDDVQITAICEVDKNRRDSAKRKIEEKYSRKAGDRGVAAYVDFRELLARDDIDAVLIATPDHWHAIPLIEACKAGKDVYCEKPLTLTLLESQRCIEAARKYNRVVQTGSQQRSSVFGPFRKACELVRSGRIGKIKSVTVGVGGPSKWCDLPEEELEPGLDWDMWLGCAPDRPYHSSLSARRGVSKPWPQWRAYREYSGGSHTDMGAHHYDIAQWALGMDQSGPVKIIPPEDPSSGKGVRYIYANGVEIIHGGPSGCTFTGTEGTLRIDRGHLSADPPDAILEPIGDDEVHLYKSDDHHRNWIDCIRSRQRPVADVEIGARSVSVVHLGNLAYWHGQTLNWNPETWRFDDPQTNQWLDCERRDPWQLPSI